MNDLSHKTAIHRRNLPKPTQWLLNTGRIWGPTLDYGCGKCHELNNLHFPCDGYDPFYRKDGITRYSYSTIICNYVLNVLPAPQERRDIIYHIQQLLTPKGLAYITVRMEPKKMHGFTKIGTWQGIVQLPPRLQLIHTAPTWKMYMMDKTTSLLDRD